MTHSGVQKRFKAIAKADIMALAEKASFPFLPIYRPQELFDDPHLNASGALVDTDLYGGIKTKLPKLPLRFDNYDFGLRHNSSNVSEGSRPLLSSIGVGK